MKVITKNDFVNLSLVEKGKIILSKGKHLTQIRTQNYLQNLYLFEDFFVEIYYSISTNKIDKIEVMTDLSRIDQYIDGVQTNTNNEMKLN